MPVIIPYVPKNITVHLGPPNQWAENVTVSFPEYVKNVASSGCAIIGLNRQALVPQAVELIWSTYDSKGATEGDSRNSVDTAADSANGTPLGVVRRKLRPCSSAHRWLTVFRSCAWYQVSVPA